MSEPPKSSLFRSEVMSLVQLFIPLDLAHPATSELGELGVLQFRDMSPDVTAFQRTYTDQIKRLDDMHRRLRFLREQCTKAAVDVKLPADNASFYTRARTLQDVDDLDEKLATVEDKLLHMNDSLLVLAKRFTQLTEMRHVLREATFFFEEAETREINGVSKASMSLLSDDQQQSLLSPDVEAGGRKLTTGFVAGVIRRDRLMAFERLLWRVLRGNLLMKTADIEEPIVDPVTEEPVTKSVFIVFAHGQELLAKIRKISESLGGTPYNIDAASERRAEQTLEVATSIEDLNNVIFNTSAARRAELLKIGETLAASTIFVEKEKATYHTMNLFQYDAERKHMIAEGWAPTQSLPAIQYALQAAAERTGSTVPPIMNEIKTNLQPPTYHKTNKFTRGFQEIVDSYGMASYREVNPGLFTIITFPFLFAVMFGDFGHGTLMAIAGIFMCVKEKSLAKVDAGEIFKIMFAGRYIILLMGFFSIYTGLIYNDAFSMTVYLAPSMWKWPEAQESNSTVILQAERIEGAVYPFGIDPAWHDTDNILIFLNSYKMKMSIIFGVIHMSFGICMTVFNHRYFKRRFDIFAEFIPQILFLQSIFGYLVFAIIYKWVVNPSTMPGLLNMLIFMFLEMGDVKPENQLFPGQEAVQKCLLAIAIICVPWMLVLKPWHLRREHMKRAGRGYSTVDLHSPAQQLPDSPSESKPTSPSGGGVIMDASGHGSHASSGGHGGHGGSEEFAMGEIVVHQVIHTIEFCLGCISNTASYLRLWALSLAHAQLSDVLWTMTIRNTVSMGPVVLFGGWGLWFALTVSILLVMEGLSAFLHALRLHWVEFNGKFYEGNGTKFEPFAFSRIVSSSSGSGVSGSGGGSSA